MVIVTLAGRTDSRDAITGHARTASRKDVAHAPRTQSRRRVSPVSAMSHRPIPQEWNDTHAPGFLSHKAEFDAE